MLLTIEYFLNQHVEGIQDHNLLSLFSTHSWKQLDKSWKEFDNELLI